MDWLAEMYLECWGSVDYIENYTPEQDEIDAEERDARLLSAGLVG